MGCKLQGLPAVAHAISPSVSGSQNPRLQPASDPYNSGYIGAKKYTYHVVLYDIIAGFTLFRHPPPHTRFWLFTAQTSDYTRKRSISHCKHLQRLMSL